MDILFKLDLDWLNMPNCLSVFLNRTVRGKFAHSGCIENGHPRPVVPVLIRLADLFLTVYIGLVIREKHVRIAFYQRVYQWLKQVSVAVGEVPGIYQINRFSQMRIRMVVIPGMIAGGPLFSNFLSGQSKEEKVFLSDLVRSRAALSPSEAGNAVRPLH